MLPTQEKQFYALRQKPKPNAGWRYFKACGLVISGYALAQLDYKPASGSVKLGVSNLRMMDKVEA